MSLFVDIEKKLESFTLKIKFENDNTVLALLGASGCGKSMTLKCIAGIEKPDKGKIILNGKTLFDSEKKINLPPQERNVGYLFQQYALFPNMTVEQNIACGVRDKDKFIKKEKVKGIIQKMQLQGNEKKLPSKISGGEQQRVALARILVNEPEVLLLDEPFSALDSYLKLKLEQEVRTIIKTFDKPVILVSHDRNEVYRIASETAILNKGKVETIGDVESVFTNPVTLNGAILTGYKNISKIHEIAQNYIHAENWGIDLKVKELPSGTNYIGIRTKEIRLGGNENNIHCEVVDLLDNPYSITLVLKPLYSSSTDYLYFQLLKDRWKEINSKTLQISIPADSIIPLIIKTENDIC